MLRVKRAIFKRNLTLTPIVLKKVLCQHVYSIESLLRLMESNQE